MQASERCLNALEPSHPRGRGSRQDKLAELGRTRQPAESHGTGHSVVRQPLGARARQCGCLWVA
jgi:hypothetical protein